jgi:ketosteroid isomerase-like protein
MSALALGRQMLEGWNADRLDLVFATFDEDVVVRLDPDWPERVAFGRASAEQFWHGVREMMGDLAFEVEEEHDLGDRAFWRVRQSVHSRSGVEGAYSWSFVVTARQGRVILVEFAIEDAGLRADLGIGAA